jgi:type II secretory pathway component PulK
LIKKKFDSLGSYLLQESCSRLTSAQGQSGVALPLVIVTIVLASTIVTAATYSTYISGRLNASLEQGLKAEYLVKSALNFARILIFADSGSEDSDKDPWRIFERGQSVPAEILAIEDRNVKVDLEISPLGSKLPLSCLLEQGATPTYWYDNFARLFTLLGFDQDDEEEKRGRFKGTVFKPNELVANLVDYVDEGDKSLDVAPYSGIEDQIPAGVFKNRKILRESELSTIPGFTPARIQKLLLYIVAGASCSVNINSASTEVLQAVHPDISQVQAQQIIETRAEKGPFKEYEELSGLISPDALASLRTLQGLRTTNFSVIAKAQFAANTTYLRARISSQGSSSMPKVTQLELY